MTSRASADSGTSLSRLRLPLDGPPRRRSRLPRGGLLVAVAPVLFEVDESARGLTPAAFVQAVEDEGADPAVKAKLRVSDLIDRYVVWPDVILLVLDQEDDHGARAHWRA